MRVPSARERNTRAPERARRFQARMPRKITTTSAIDPPTAIAAASCQTHIGRPQAPRPDNILGARRDVGEPERPAHSENPLLDRNVNLLI